MTSFQGVAFYWDFRFADMRRRPDDIIERRALTRLEAAEMAALSPAAFDKARKAGKYPDPTLPGGRFDLKLMHMAMNCHSGLVDEPLISPLEQWRRSRAGSS
jgi:hypothetical protein